MRKAWTQEKALHKCESVSFFDKLERQTALFAFTQVGLLALTLYDN
jgi:hypothetical protein